MHNKFKLQVAFHPIVSIYETMTEDIQHEITDNDIDNVPSIKIISKMKGKKRIKTKLINTLINHLLYYVGR